ncbi:GM12662 [Drosophila sechellia]|uniref:GM12662 n=1 Tax=Drosophila sechellia TaxID=7238 RepID=B4I0U6_DROSE|nr:GM12662 [Drosophila sechellia]
MALKWLSGQCRKWAMQKSREMETLDAGPNQKQILLRQISTTVRPGETKAIVSDVETKEASSGFGASA